MRQSDQNSFRDFLFQFFLSPAFLFPAVQRASVLPTTVLVAVSLILVLFWFILFIFSSIFWEVPQEANPVSLAMVVALLLLYCTCQQVLLKS